MRSVLSPAKLSILALLSITSTSSAFAQPTDASSKCVDTAGVYLTSAEFRTDSLTDGVCVDNESNKFRIGFLGTIDGHLGGTIKLKEADTKRRYTYGSTFGILYDGHKYRLQKRVQGSHAVRGLFKLVDTRGLYIYTQRDPGVHGVSRNHATRVFYSKTVDGRIKPLRMGKLEKDFPSRREFLLEVKNNRSKLTKVNDTGEYAINNMWSMYPE